ncbi:MAG: glycosyl hydrolase [Bacteroidota bacterium]
MKQFFSFFAIICFFIFGVAAQQPASVWPVEKAKQWYSAQGFLAGANYLPATAINQLEMFQAATFDTATIHREMKLAQSIGFNTMRVFLHDLLWKEDAPGFKKRLHVFLRICAQYGIKPMLVFFDSCWDPYPKSGKQRIPIPGLHNSGWVQSPGAEVLGDSTQWNYLERYVKDVVKTFRNDNRILCWDVWNEPDNGNASSYGKIELANKTNWVNKLLPKVFDWVRSQLPTQPVTSGVWTWWNRGWNKDSLKNRSLTEQIQLDNSDVITFHCYNNPGKDFEKAINDLQSNTARPIICTEYMARGEGNTVITIMPIGKKYNVGLINWGFVDGKEQTKFPWNSWDKRYTTEPLLWHHDLFEKDLTPYKAEEIELMKRILVK